MRVPIVVSLALAGALAACSGPGASTPPVRGSIASPAYAASIGITIPHKSATQKSATQSVRPLYVSSATQSAQITISLAGQTVFNQAAALTAGASGCTSTLASTYCTITAPLSAGAYTVTITTYDGPIVGGATSGNALSAAQSVPFTVTANATNQLNVTLGGIPASIAFVPLAGQSWVSGNTAAGFSLPSAQATTFDIVALDADNDPIVGAGAPTIAVQSSNAALTVSPASVTQPNLFTVTAAFTTTLQGGSLQVTATPASGGGSPITSTVAVAAAATGKLYALGACGGHPCWTTYPIGESAATGAPNIFNAAISSPNLILFHNGTSLITRVGSGQAEVVAEFAAGATTPTTALGGYNPAAVTFDSAGNVDILDTLQAHTGNVEQLNEFGFGATAPTRSITVSSSASATPIDLHADGSGNVYVEDLDRAGQFIEEFGPSGSAPIRTIALSAVTGFQNGAIFMLLSSGSAGQTFAVSSNGTVYVVSTPSAPLSSPGNTCTASTSSQILVYGPNQSTSPTTFAPNTTNVCSISAITVNANGDPVLSVLRSDGSGAVEVDSSSGAPIAMYTLPTDAGYVATDPVGDIFALQFAPPNSSIYQLAPGGGSPVTSAIVSGALGIGFGP